MTQTPKEEIAELTWWIKNNPGKFDGVSEKTQRIKHLVMENPNLDPIQNNCKYGYVLPDRCRYTAHLGCDCGAYPPIKPPVTSEIINTEFPRLMDIPEEIMDVFDGPEQECYPLTSEEQLSLLKSLEEVEANLNDGYVGGMTEYWNRRREHLLKELQEVQMRDWNL